MTDAQKIILLKSMTGETSEDILNAYLKLAGDKILERRFPFKSDVQIVPVKYHTRQIEIASYLLNKRGAEGEVSHSENGISRSYESASVPESMLKDILPCAAVLSGGGE